MVIRKIVIAGVNENENENNVNMDWLSDHGSVDEDVMSVPALPPIDSPEFEAVETEGGGHEWKFGGKLRHCSTC